MKNLLTLLLMSVPALALAQYSNPDRSFYEHLAEGGMAEVEAGKLAQKHGTSQAVKEFAAMMVKDHSAANDKLKKLADSKSVKLPEGPSVTQKAKKKMLEVKSGSSFDKDYIEEQDQRSRRHRRAAQEGNLLARMQMRRPARRRSCRPLKHI